MFMEAGVPRPQYDALLQRLLELQPSELKQRQQTTNIGLLNQGITFTVYGHDEGTEKIFPYDLLPRIITSGECGAIERGLTQRITALNLFLKDIYHDGKILNDGVVPRELVYSCKHYRREMRGIRLRRNMRYSVFKYSITCCFSFSLNLNPNGWP